MSWLAGLVKLVYNFPRLRSAQHIAPALTNWFRNLKLMPPLFVSFSKIINI